MSSSERYEIDQRILPTTNKKSIWTKSTFNDNTYHHRNFSRENIKDEQSPFVFPSCSQTLAYLQWWKAQKKKAISKRKIYKDRPTKISQYHNTLQKLHKNIKIDIEEVKKLKDPDKIITTITDIYPQYFTELSGRSVKEKFSLEQYIRDVREILKTRILIGQEKDDCIYIDQQFEQESRRLQQIQYRCQQYVSGFEELLSKDHQKSMSLLEEAEREVILTEKISAQRDELAKQLGQSRLDVYNLEESWRIVKMCQMFLCRISPVAWKIKRESFQFDLKKNFVSVDTTDLFGRYKILDENVSLENLIELFEQDIADTDATELYFEDPFDLIRILRAMETQNLNALIHLESLAAPMVDMTMTITVTEARIKREISEITSMINDLENSIAKTETRAANLEEYANYLLQDVFRRLVCSEEVLYLRVFVEDTYESCIGPNDANLDSFSMMKWIERTYEELNLQLDNLPREIVRICEREGFQQEMKVIKEAEDATRKFELMHRLLDALQRIMDMPTRKKRPLIRRSVPIVTKIKPPLQPLKPTDEEAEYCTFFTDYCKRDDFITYRSKFPDDFDLTFQSKHNDIETATLKDVFLNKKRKQDKKENKEEERKK